MTANYNTGCYYVCVDLPLEGRMAGVTLEVRSPVAIAVALAWCEKKSYKVEVQMGFSIRKGVRRGLDVFPSKLDSMLGWSDFGFGMMCGF